LHAETEAGRNVQLPLAALLHGEEGLPDAWNRQLVDLGLDRPSLAATFFGIVELRTIQEASDILDLDAIRHGRGLSRARLDFFVLEAVLQSGDALLGLVLIEK